MSLACDSVSSLPHAPLRNGAVWKFLMEPSLMTPFHTLPEETALAPFRTEFQPSWAMPQCTAQKVSPRSRPKDMHDDPVDPLSIVCATTRVPFEFHWNGMMHVVTPPPSRTAQPPSCATWVDPRSSGKMPLSSSGTTHRESQSPSRMEFVNLQTARNSDHACFLSSFSCAQSELASTSSMNSQTLIVLATTLASREIHPLFLVSQRFRDDNQTARDSVCNPNIRIKL